MSEDVEVKWMDVVRRMAAEDNMGLARTGNQPLVSAKKVKQGYQVTLGVDDRIGDKIMQAYGPKGRKDLMIVCLFIDRPAFECTEDELIDELKAEQDKAERNAVPWQG